MHNRTSNLQSRAIALLNEGKTMDEIAAITNESPDTIRKLVNRKVTNNSKGKKNRGWRELVAHATAGQLFCDDADITQRFSSTKIKSDSPIAVVYTGDWHLGDRYSNYATWKDHIEAIMNNDNVFMVALGDENENARSFRNLSVVLEQVLSPALQVELLNSLFDELIDKQKVLAKVIGNHDGEFDERLYGQKLVGYTEKMETIPIFDNRGLLEINVGDQSYSNLLFHKSRFRSFIRPTHGAYREWQMSYPAEVVAGGHDHVPGVEIIYGRDPMGNTRETFLIKSGTYQDSEFGWKYFHNGGPMTPVVVYFPHEHKKVVFTKLEDALKFME